MCISYLLDKTVMILKKGIYSIYTHFLVMFIKLTKVRVLLCN